jgi:glycosyltransferase involved in cell wall biosynthesis
MKVLMSAYACEPNKGSEPGVGWNWALQGARFHEVWVLTRANNRDAIEAELKCSPVPNLHIIYHDLPRWARLWKQGGRGVWLYYLLWQLTALAVVRGLHNEIKFDVIHHVTFNTIDLPGFLWCLAAPFIWGPVGGGQEPSPAMKQYFGRSWYREILRIGRKRLVQFNPLVRLATRRASCVIVANSDTQRHFERIGASHLIRELETAVAVIDDPIGQRRHDEDVFTVFWAGGLIPRKAPLLAIEVLADLRRRGVRARLLIAGDGPLRPRIAKYIQDLRLDSEVSLLGTVPYSSMHELYNRADVFLFSSLHDTSGNVLLEAMSHRLPVVVLDQHGASEIVSDECGVKVPIVSAEQVRSDLTSALDRLAADPELRCRMGEAGRRRIAQVYDWEHKGQLLREIYLHASSRTR